MTIPAPIRRPYNDNHIPTYEQMSKQPLVWVATRQLRPTQQMLRLDRLLALLDGEPAEGPDPHPHIIELEGELWIHNGHTRWVTAMIQRRSQMLVRLWRYREAA